MLPEHLPHLSRTRNHSHNQVLFSCSTLRSCHILAFGLFDFEDPSLIIACGGRLPHSLIDGAIRLEVAAGGEKISRQSLR